MRLVVTSDTHVKVDVKKMIPDGDVFLHVGDLMTSGYPNDFATQLEWLAEVPHKTKIFVPGNHDFHLMVYPGPALQDLRRVGVTVLGLPGNTDFETMTLPNRMKILGLPYVEKLPRWAFSLENPDYSRQMYNTLNRNRNVDIIASHSPPCGILDTTNDGKHRGVREYMTYIEDTWRQSPPKYWFSGHIHEAYGEFDNNSTKFYNVAMSDRIGNHANPAVVLDI